MQNTVHGDACPPSGPPQDIRDRIVSDLGFLMTQIQASMRLIDAALACESSSGDEELPANVVVLDDVTPRYARANAALNTCRTEANKICRRAAFRRKFFARQSMIRKSGDRFSSRQTLRVCAEIMLEQ